MRVFCDTNVLISAFLWPGGVCDQVMQRIFREHDLVTSEIVIEEFKEKRREKFTLPEATIGRFAAELMRHHVEPRPPRPYPLSINAPDDPWVVASAVQAQVEVLATGDKRLRSVADEGQEVTILTPREFLDRHRPSSA